MKNYSNEEQARIDKLPEMYRNAYKSQDIPSCGVWQCVSVYKLHVASCIRSQLLDNWGKSEIWTKF